MDQPTNPGGSSGAGSIRIRVNGEERAITAPASVADLIESLGLRPQFVAVERNRELVPRAEHPVTPLQDGDEIEVVTLVGGG